MTRPHSFEKEPRAQCFAPVVDAHTRILILGSLPGRASLRAGRYYAHPQNQFWRLMGAVVGEDLVHIDYDVRLQILLAHKIGLWDTIAQATRSGSLDGAIRAPQGNDLKSLFATLPSLQLLAFNGKAAAEIGRRHLGAPCIGHPAAAVLPSSSPANTAPFQQKLEIWQGVLQTALHL